MRITEFLVACTCLFALAAVPTSTAAQAVALSGTMGERALLVFDGAAPIVMAPGDVRQGVRLISADGDSAVVEIQGARQTLRIGASPVRSATPAGSAGASNDTRIVLNAGSGGHFFGTGKINGASMHFMVDTGASTVALSATQAKLMGIDYRAGELVRISTANGDVPGYRVSLNSVQIGGVEVFRVDATVVPSEMPFVLLGNSFLSRFRIKQENDLMLLERRF